MAHLEIEEIAKFAEGHVSKSEHERFTKHIAQCERCRQIYSATLTFVDKERASSKRRLRLPGFIKIQSWLPQSVRKFFVNAKLIPAFSAVAILLILLIIPSFFKADEHVGRQVKSIQERFLVPGSGYDFGGAAEKKQSALRAGIFIESLSILKIPKQEELIKKINKKLIMELKNISKEEAETLSCDFQDIEGRKETINNIEGLLKTKSLAEPFLFGRFLEKSLLGTFENKRPPLEDIKKFKQIARDMGVWDAFESLGKAVNCIDVKDICEGIEKQFFLIK